MKTMHSMVVAVSIAFGSCHAAAQEVFGGNVYVYQPPMQFGITAEGQGTSGQFSYSGNGFGVVMSQFGESSVFANVNKWGSVFVPQGMVNGSASVWGSVEGNAYAGHSVGSNFSSSYNGSWQKTTAGASATGGGMATSIVEGNFGASSQTFKPTVVIPTDGKG